MNRNNGNSNQQGPLPNSRQLALDDLKAILDAGQGSIDSGKSALESGRQKIHDCYRAGIAASVLVQLQTTLTDYILLDIWHRFINRDQNEQLSLLAVGGYGRGELHPHSDIDIAILLETKPDATLSDAISLFITHLWDLGLDVGQSVRTVDDCFEQAQADVTVVTNLMEARLLCGSQPLFDTMAKTIAPDQMWASQAYFDAKMLEQKQRRKKYQGNAYRLEPNLKESSGGLRDLQTIFWVSQRHFGTKQWEDLINQGLLTATEFETLMSGLEFLWRVRYLLHRLAKRREDRLLFDHQREIAHEFGFMDDTRNLSIEQFMQMYFRHVMELQRLNEIILQGFGGIISGVTAATAAIPVNKRFQIRNGFLEVTHDGVFKEYPPALLEVFILFGNEVNANKIRANTVRLIRSHLHLIDKQFRDDIIVRDSFIQIFRNPNKLTRCIRMMNRHGVLAAYLPQFAAIVGRMQYDLFHMYTVDEHTTRVIRNLRRFALSEHDDELPHCSNVMQKIEKPELLYLMGLFHDIAKGRGGDHSELGSEDALVFCQHHGLDAIDSGLVSWGVLNHLIMSTTAQRKDISDPDVIHDFATHVSSLKHLNHLYLLTVADIRATNLELWNSFKENLLRDLYESTARMLHRGLENPLDMQHVIEQKKLAARSLIKSVTVIGAESLWQRLNDNYFLHYQPEEIATHASAILPHANNADPLVLLTNSSSRGSTEIMLYVQDHNSLFALVASALDQLNLNILSASISTTADGYALDSYYVLEGNGDPINEPFRVKQVHARLTETLLHPELLPAVSVQYQPRRLQHFGFKPRIEYDNSVSADLTSVYIEATDRPGILSLIGRSFMNTNTQVHTAKIATFGERIEDVFFVTNSFGEQLKSTEEQDRLTAELLYNLMPDTSQPDIS